MIDLYGGGIVLFDESGKLFFFKHWKNVYRISKLRKKQQFICFLGCSDKYSILQKTKNKLARRGGLEKLYTIYDRIYKIKIALDGLAWIEVVIDNLIEQVQTHYQDSLHNGRYNISNSFPNMTHQRQHYLDLPLSINPKKINQISEPKNNNLPMQLKNDLYRVNSKENIQHHALVKIPQDPKSSQKKVAPADKKNNNGNNKKDSNRLKEIIKRKLNFNQPNACEIQMTENAAKDQKHQDNRYHQLLRQFYGNPNSQKSIKAWNQKQNKIRQPQLKRHESAKSIKSGDIPDSKLTRMRSYSSIKSPSKFSSKASTTTAKQPSYMDIYMQKRKAILFL